MAQHFTDFFDPKYWTGQSPPDGFTVPWGTNGTWQTEDNVAAPSGRLILHTGSSSGRVMLSWSDIGTASDQDILALVRTTSTSTTQLRVGVRISGGSGSETGYTAQLVDGDELNLARFDGGSATVPETTAFSWSANTWIWVRVRANGSDVKVKAWEDGGSEPAWMIEYTDPSPLGAGHAAVGRNSQFGDKRFGVVSVGTGGDTPLAERPDPAEGDPRQLVLTGAWSWFGDPRAISYNGTTYFGFVADGGDVVAAALNETTDAVETFVLNSSLDDNDHAAPAFRVRSDGKIQAFYSAHNDSVMRFRTTTSAEDISAWDAEGTTTGGSTNDITYPNPIDLSDRVVLHWRRNLSLTERDAVFSESTDDGGTWATLHSLFFSSGKIPYLKCALHPTTTDRVDYVVTDRHPNDATRASLYHFYREGASFYESDGTKIKDLADLSTSETDAITPADATQVWDGPTEAEDGWQWDIAHDASGNPVILFAGIADGVTLNDSAPHRAMHARWNGTSWAVNEIASMGKTIRTGDDGTYSAGAALDPEDPGRAWVAVESSSGDAAELREYRTTDDGATWSLEQTVDEGATDMRPYVPRDRSTAAAVLWMGGLYESYTDFRTAVFALEVASSVEITPTTAETTTTAPDPTVAAGASAQPTTAETTTTAPDPTVSTTTTVTPTTAETVTEAPDPTVAAGASVQPTTTETNTTAPDPTVSTASGAEVQPTTAETVTEAPDPTVSVASGTTVTPTAATTETTAPDPTVQIITPDPDPVPGDLMLGIWDEVAAEWIAIPVASVRPLPRPAPSMRRRANGAVSTEVTIAGGTTSTDRTRGWDVDAPYLDRWADGLAMLDRLTDPGYPQFGGFYIDDGPRECRAVRPRLEATRGVGNGRLTFTLLARSP